MTDSHYVIPQPSLPAVPVAGETGLFPVHRIYCVGRNYADHAREMGANPDREPPFFFCKPADAIVTDDITLPFPSKTADLHHEVELVIAIGEGGQNIAQDAAHDHVYGYAVGVDLTRRDLQAAAKAGGKPWDTGKAFDQSAPISTIIPVADCGHLENAEIWLSVNGSLRQQGSTADMIWSVPEIIATLSQFFTLLPGDLIFTGTPAGVGALQSGDRVIGSVEGVGSVKFTVG